MDGGEELLTHHIYLNITVKSRRAQLINIFLRYQNQLHIYLFLPQFTQCLIKLLDITMLSYAYSE